MNAGSLPTPVVPTRWLAESLNAPDLVVVDASWYLPASGRDGRTEYLDRHLPGAVFWDLDRLSDPTADLPHMMPDPTWLAAEIGALGLGDGDRVVVYDGSGVNLSAPRVWWMLRALGHQRVAVLDGGMGKWRAEGRPTGSGAGGRPARAFTPALQAGLFRTLADLQRLRREGGVQLLDARSRGRFEGREPEPRDGVRSGHIPGSRNLPSPDLVGPDGVLLSGHALRAAFESSGIDLHRPVIATCGSGVTACALVLGLEALGHRDHAVYDGSWSEWGRSGGDTPVEVGPAPVPP